MKLPEGVGGDATFSACRRYRYRLVRYWDEPGEHVRSICFCGLNPSTAGAAEDDATIRKLYGFARRWGFNKLVMVNLYAWIETWSTQLLHAADPVGEGNPGRVELAARDAHRFVACWGASPPVPTEARLLERLRRCEVDVWAFKLTKAGRPYHPLYLPGATEPFVWRRAATGGL